MGATKSGSRHAIHATLLLVALLGACAVLVKAPRTSAFSHSVHMDEGLECESCHANIMESTELRQPVPPSREACEDCHSEEEGDEMYAAALASPRRTRIWVPTFSHSDHMAVEELGGDCTKCHVMTGEGGGARDMRHRTCMSCHREEFRDASCKACHGEFDENGPVPATHFSHGGDFERRHGAIARGNEAVCDHCHRESDCATCHSRHIELVPSERHPDRLEQPFVHRAGFEVRHAIEARQDQARCLTCHRTETCSECHQRRGVAGAGALSQHPAGWMTPGDRHFHGRKARREAALCASCHDQGAASNCVSCHKVGGSGGNPHPPGWSSRLDRRAPSCSPCHR